jgi:hypothetical protein
MRHWDPRSGIKNGRFVRMLWMGVIDWIGVVVGEINR